MRLAARESPLARSVGALSRLARPRRRHDPAGQAPRRVDPRRDRPPRGAAAARDRPSSRRRTARRRPPRWSAEILRPRFRLAHNGSGANLVSGVASTLARARGDAELGLFEVDEARAAGGRCAGSARVRSASATSSATSSTATASSSSSPSAGARRSPACPAARALVVNARRSRASARSPRRTARSVAYGIDDPARRAAVAPARRRLEVLRPLRRRRTTTPPPTSAISATTAARAAATRARRSRSRRARSSCTGSSVPRSSSSPRRDRAGSSSALPGPLQRLQRARRPRRSPARSAPTLDEIAAGLARFSAAFGRFERIAVGGKRLLLLLIKNPAGANEAVRTLVDGRRAAGRRRRAERRDRRRARRLVDLGRRLRAAARRARDASSRPASRAAELALRFKYGGLDESRDRGRARPRAGARPRPRADARRRRARRAPHLHGDARPAAARRRARPREAVLGAGGMTTIRVGHLYPGLPQHLRRPRQHRRASRAAPRWRGHELEVTADRHGRRDRPGRARPLLRRRRPGSRAAARRGGPRARRPSRCARRVDGRRGAARRVRRLPAARPRLPRPPRRGHAGRRPARRSRPSPASGA